MTTPTIQPVAVVILNYRASAFVRTCLASFERHRPPGYRYHYIVVDASGAESEARNLRALPREFGFASEEIPETKCDCGTAGKAIPDLILCVTSENQGYSKGNNLGARIALRTGSSHLLIANPDIELLDATSVPRLLAALRGIPKAVCAFPTVVGLDGKTTGNHQGPFERESNLQLFIGPSLFDPVDRWVGRVSRRISAWRYRAFGAYRIYTSLGCFFAADAKRFAALGMFDEDFFLYCEESAFGEKVRRNGGVNLFVPSARILHKHEYVDSPVHLEHYLRSVSLYRERYLKRTPRFNALVSRRNKMIAFLKGRVRE